MLNTDYNINNIVNIKILTMLNTVGMITFWMYYVI